MSTIIQEAINHCLDADQYEQLEQYIENNISSLSLDELNAIWTLDEPIIQRSILQNTDSHINANFRQLAFNHLNEVLAYSLCYDDNLTPEEKNALLAFAPKEKYFNECDIVL